MYFLKLLPLFMITMSSSLSIHTFSPQHTHTHAFTHVHAHTHTCKHSLAHIYIHRKKFGEIHMKQLPDHSPEIPQVLWQDHPIPSLSLGLAVEGPLWGACAVTTEVPPASPKSQAGAHQLVSRPSEPVPPDPRPAISRPEQGASPQPPGLRRRQGHC